MLYLPVQEVEHIVQKIRKKHQNKTIEDTHIHNVVSTHKSEAEIVSQSDGKTVVAASRFEAPATRIQAGKGVESQDVQDVHVQGTTIKKKKKSWMGNRTKIILGKQRTFLFWYDTSYKNT